MNVDRKIGVTSLTPNDALAGRNQVSASNTQLDGDHVIVEANRNHIPIPVAGGHISPPGMIQYRQIEYAMSDFLGSCVRLPRPH
jgi:hypothetical protein